MCRFALSPIRTVLAVGTALALSTACVMARSDRPATLGVDILARQIVPGEPLRIGVRASEPVRDLDAVFLGRDVHLVRLSEGSESEVWSGWTLIPLDTKPGAEAIEFSGTTVRGRRIAATHAVTIEFKEFPEERLTVQSQYVSPPREVEDRLAREREKLGAIYSERRDVIPHARPFLRPVDGVNTSIFGMRRFYNEEPRSPHPGQDLRAAEGTPVRASGDGLVVLAQDLYYSGNTVILDHGGGLFTLYAHLSAIDVEEGQTALAGAVLGKSGSTGRVTGPHLHWGAKIGNTPFDPSALLDPALFD